MARARSFESAVEGHDWLAVTPAARSAPEAWLNPWSGSVLEQHAPFGFAEPIDVNADYALGGDR
jgi:hypothetical protein